MSGAPAYIPAWLRKELPAALMPMRFSEAERRICRPKPKIAVSEWAHKYRMVENSALKGR